MLSRNRCETDGVNGFDGKIFCSTDVENATGHQPCEPENGSTWSWPEFACARPRQPPKPQTKEPASQLQHQKNANRHHLVLIRGASCQRQAVTVSLTTHGLLPLTILSFGLRRLSLERHSWPPKKSRLTDSTPRTHGLCAGTTHGSARLASL